MWIKQNQWYLGKTPQPITDMQIKVQDEVIENVKEFVYLGSLLTWNNNYTKKIKRRIANAKGVA